MIGMHSVQCGCLKQKSVSEEKHLPQRKERELGKASYSTVTTSAWMRGDVSRGARCAEVKVGTGPRLCLHTSSLWGPRVIPRQLEIRLSGLAESVAS